MPFEAGTAANRPDAPASRIEHALAEIDSEEISEAACAEHTGIIRAALHEMHEADIADLLESLPKPQRQTVWGLIETDALGLVLLEVSDNLCEDLVEMTPTGTMVTILQTLEGADVATLMRELPKNDAARLMRLANLSGDAEIRASLSFDENSVGARMDFNPVIAGENETIGMISSRLQGMEKLPGQCDKLFVVDDWERLAGVLPLKKLLVSAPAEVAKDAMVSARVHSFTPDTDIDTAAGAFERYDLITAPVVDDKHKIVGRITIGEIFDHVHDDKSQELLTSAGIADKEDLFASVLERFGNRWKWLFINLVAVILISRIIGLFEHSIEKLVPLAALMPIVASMSGNIGNQTATLMIRALALQQINPNNWKGVIRNESVLSIVNGLVWGALIAVIAYFFYERIDLSVVLLVAMTMCAFFGAAAGFFVPILMQRLRRDPALGSTVVISIVTDSLGFFVFLGIATIFLL